MTRIFVAILMLVVAALLVAFAIANRTLVTVAFDPFDPTAPAYVVTLPLYILSFIILILGVAVGGIVGWFTQGKRRRYRRRLESELMRVRAELDRAVREKTTQEAALRGMRATATTVPARLPAN
jgi:heme/copper-type cytochrome/quinol oxidase subunit 1